MHEKSTLIKISNGRCSLKLARPVYYHLHLNLGRNFSRNQFILKNQMYALLTKTNCGLKDNFPKRLLKLLPIKLQILWQKNHLNVISYWSEKRGLKSD